LVGNPLVCVIVQPATSLPATTPAVSPRCYLHSWRRSWEGKKERSNYHMFLMDIFL